MKQKKYNCPLCGAPEAGKDEICNRYQLTDALKTSPEGSDAMILTRVYALLGRDPATAVDRVIKNAKAHINETTEYIKWLDNLNDAMIEEGRK